MDLEWKLEVVSIPVSDVDRAKQFYSEQLGFTVDLDIEAGSDLRFVQLTPPGSACSIVIGKGNNPSPPGTAQGTQLVVTDIDAARVMLLEHGVEVSPIRNFTDGRWIDGKGGPWNSFLFFSDPDGNGWVVQERPA